jgi:hypothetical protein
MRINSLLFYCAAIAGTVRGNMLGWDVLVRRSLRRQPLG